MTAVPRRFVRIAPYVLLGAVIAAFLVGAGLSLTGFIDYRQQEESGDRTGDWAASQLALEYVRLLDTIDRFRAGDPDASPDAIRLRFDILWSRLPVILESEETVWLRGIPGVVGTSSALLSALEANEPELERLAVEGRPAADRLRAALEPYGTPLQQMVQAAMLTEHGEEDRLRATRDRVLLFLVGTLAAGALLVWRLATEVQDGRRLRRFAVEEERKAKLAHSRLYDALEAMSEGFALFDADDRLVLCNERYRQFFGPDAGQVRPGTPFEDLVRLWVSGGRNLPDDSTELWLAERLQRHLRPEAVHQRRLADGRWVQIRERRTADGGSVGVVLDVSGLKHEQEALERSRTRFRRLVEISSTGVLIGRRDGRVTYANGTLLDMLGYTQEDLLAGRLDWRRLTAPEFAAVDRRALVELLRDGRCAPHRKEFLARDGRRVPVWVGAAVLDRSPDGEIVGAAFVTDLTELERAEAALQVSEERLRLALAASKLGTWDYDPATGGMVWCDRTRAIFGVPPGVPVDRALFLSRIHPDDRERIDAHALRALDPAGDGIYEAEYRVVPPSGEVRWVSARGRAFFREDDGRRVAVRLLGTHLDVTERRRAEEELARMAAAVQESNERARLATEAVGLGTWDTDLVSGVTTWSPQCRAIFGMPSDLPVTDETFLAAVHPDDRAAVAAANRAAVDPAGTGAYRAEFRVERPDGSVRWVATQGIARFAELDGVRRAVRFLGTMMDVTASREAEERLRASLAEKETLLREVHHRVKNNLQAMWGLLQVEAIRLADLPRARARLEAIGQRIHVLGQIHQQLYASPDVSRIDLADHLRDLCRGLSDLQPQPAPVAVRVEAEPLRCDLGTALPLGLIANELVSNALKHAFPDGRTGEVRVRLHRAGGNVELTVADDGIGQPPVGTSAGGIGSMLVQALAQQIDSDAAVEIGASGRTVRVSVPEDRFESAAAPAPSEPLSAAV